MKNCISGESGCICTSFLSAFAWSLLSQTIYSWINQQLAAAREALGSFDQSSSQDNIKTKTDMDYFQIKASKEMLLLSYPKMKWEMDQLKMTSELVALTEKIQCLEDA